MNTNQITMNTNQKTLNNTFMTRHRWIALVNKKLSATGQWHHITPQIRRDIQKALLDNIDTESELLRRFA